MIVLIYLSFFNLFKLLKHFLLFEAFLYKLKTRKIHKYLLEDVFT